MPRVFRAFLFFFSPKQIFIYCFVGSMAAFTQLSTLYVLVAKWHWYPVHANVPAYFLGFITAFIGHRLVTFAKTIEKNHHLLMKYTLLALINFSLNQSGFIFLFHFLHWQYLVALLVDIGFVTIISFLCSKFLVFKA